MFRGLVNSLELMFPDAYNHPHFHYCSTSGYNNNSREFRQMKLKSWNAPRKLTDGQMWLSKDAVSCGKKIIIIYVNNNQHIFLEKISNFSNKGTVRTDLLVYLLQSNPFPAIHTDSPAFWYHNSWNSIPQWKIRWNEPVQY